VTDGSSAGHSPPGHGLSPSPAQNQRYCNRVCDTWNSLPNFVVDASSSDNFRRLLNQVDLSKFVVLSFFLWVGHI